ncbi:radical SAM/SPASM domain-containing protein [Streptomyces sp. NRRL S-378]|uniref:radical SAM/SPASM domain-containing protein n=1 Tax=Streptomyces sp. NRRL S-378 TaxID=1463904 RepID=UPI00099D91DD|nr:radical SAM protein [Streptomyces sp. NRRL S-378]
MRDVGLIVKVTRLCNLRCTYCYDWRSGPDQRMPFDVAARMTAAALTDPEHRGVEFLWHGGEPTLIPIRYFEKVMAVQARFRRPGQPIVNSIHTNALHISEAWIDFFRRYEWQVGISVDGPREVHDSQRVDAVGRPTLERALRGYEKLRAEGLGVGVISVVDRKTLALGPDALFDFMEEVGIRDYGINFAMPEPQPHAPPGTRTDHYITTKERTEFLIGLYDRWRTQGDPDIEIREIATVRHRLAKTPGGSLPCTFAGNCFGNLYTVEANGDVNHCCYLLGDPRYRWGNIMHQDFEDIRRSPNMNVVVTERGEEEASLQQCPEVDVCRGGCPMETYMAARHDPEPPGGCCGQADFIRHVRAHPVAAERP